MDAEPNREIESTRSAETHCSIVLPDLGLDDVPVAVSLWLVDPGSEVTEGDRLLELIAGSITIDLPAPASGILVETRVTEDDPLEVGQILGTIALLNDEAAN